MKKSNVVFHYGDKELRNFIPQETFDKGLFLPLQHPPKLKTVEDPKQALISALEKPVGDSKPLSNLLDGKPLKRGITIVVDDYTRPNIHTRLLLPYLTELLIHQYAIPKEKISILIATGTHRSGTDEELKRIIGPDMIGRFPIYWHDCDHANRGAGRVDEFEVRIDNKAFRADLLLTLTDIDNHYFAGVAGGPKLLCPGICERATIEFEHLKMFGDEGFAPNVGLGILDGNPVYECKKDIVNAILGGLHKNGIDLYCLAAIIDPDGDLVYLQGGEPFSVHRDAAEVLKRVWTVQIPRRADIVVGGAAHHGTSVYQAGKGIHAAYHAVRKGGWILVAAPCPEGLGDDEYRKLLELAKPIFDRQPDKKRAIEEAMAVVLDAVKKRFRIGKQKAVDILQILRHIGWGHLHMVSDGLSPKDKELIPFEFWGREEEAPDKRIRVWLARYGKDKTITITDNPGYLVKEGAE